MTSRTQRAHFLPQDLSTAEGNGRNDLCLSNSSIVGKASLCPSYYHQGGLHEKDRVGRINERQRS